MNRRADRPGLLGTATNPIDDDGASDAEWLAALQALREQGESVIHYIPSRSYADCIDENGDPWPTCMPLADALAILDPQPSAS